MEIWKDVVGYEGLYEVSNKGNVRRRDGYIVAQITDRSGYKTLHLSKGGARKTHKTHRLVAMAFIPNPNNYPQVNHKDETRDNNLAENLEWCTSKYNNNYGTHPQKVSEALKGHIVTDETRNKSRESNLGKTRSKEFCEKMSKVKKGVPLYNKRKPVKCIETGIVYDGVTIAAEAVGTNRTQLSMVLNGRTKTAGGYHWKYI